MLSSPMSRTKLDTSGAVHERLQKEHKTRSKTKKQKLLDRLRPWPESTRPSKDETSPVAGTEQEGIAALVTANKKPAAVNSSVDSISSDDMFVFPSTEAKKDHDTSSNGSTGSFERLLNGLEKDLASDAQYDPLHPTGSGDE